MSKFSVPFFLSKFILFRHATHTNAATVIRTEMCGAQRQKIYNVIMLCVNHMFSCSINFESLLCLCSIRIVLFIFGKCQKPIYVSNSIASLWPRECPKFYFIFFFALKIKAAHFI